MFIKSDIIIKPSRRELSIVGNIFSEKEAAVIYGICTRTLSNLITQSKKQECGNNNYGKQIRKHNTIYNLLLVKAYL